MGQIHYNRSILKGLLVELKGLLEPLLELLDLFERFIKTSFQTLVLGRISRTTLRTLTHGF